MRALPGFRGACDIRVWLCQIAKNCFYTEQKRMGRIELTLLRLGMFEMLYRDDIPPVVSINEAVDLAKAYSSIESGKFVNGILDRIRKGIDRPARDPNAPPPAVPPVDAE